MDWISFFESNRIPYRTSGPNVGRNAIVCHCVWCGVDDPSEHLVVSLDGKGFKCWRNRQHAGKNPAKLIQALLNCSWEQAEQLAGQGKSLPNDFVNKVKQSLIKQEQVVVCTKLVLPQEFKKFSTLPSCKIYLNYINSRGFTINDANEYGVYYASQGLYKGRVIFSVVQDRQLVGWSGRTIYPSKTLRYKTLTNDAEKAKQYDEIPAPAPISDFLLWYDNLLNSDANTIVLCEGPMDAWKVNILGEHVGVTSTCFFTSSLSRNQLNLLHSILPKFEYKYLLLDENTFAKSARMKSDMISLGVEVKRLTGVKDPALLKTTRDLQKVLK